MAKKIRKVLPVAKGRITIPAAMRKALGIPASSLVELRVEDNSIVISKLNVPPEGSFYVYSDEEIAAFLEEDKITAETSERVRELMRAGLV